MFAPSLINGFLIKSQANENTRQLCQKLLYEGDLEVDKELAQIRKDDPNVSRTATRPNGIDAHTDVSTCENRSSEVLDPPCIRPKGVSNARLKSHPEKRKKKTSKVTKSSK